MKIKAAIYFAVAAILLVANTYSYAAPTLHINSPAAGSTMTGSFDITGTATFNPTGSPLKGVVTCTLTDTDDIPWIDNEQFMCYTVTCPFSHYTHMGYLVTVDPGTYTLSCTTTGGAADTFVFNVDTTLHTQPGNDAGKPDGAQDPCSGGDAPPGAGAPVWWVNKVNLNLYVTDTPMWYKPPFGPSVNIQLSYNSQGSAPGSPFGSKWQFNYASYLVENSGSVTVVMPDGKNDIYTLSGGVYQKPFGVFNTLVYNTGQSNYTLTLLDGTVYTYSKPTGVTSPVLTDIKDAYNNHLTITYNSGGQLVSIQDALNRSTTITYNAQGFIDTITDPFVIDADSGAHRTAHFTYYPSSYLLQRVTDMGGYWSEYSYDANGNLSGIKSLDPSDPTHTQTRTRGFTIEPSDSTPTPDPYPNPNTSGNKMGKKYRVTISNPDPNNLQGYLKEEYFYDGSNTWYVSPRDYVTYVNSVTNNMNNAVKTYYMLERYPANSATSKGRLAKVISPERLTETYYYDDSTASYTIPGYTYANTGKKATITDGNSHTTRYQYDQNGMITYFWDATVTAPTSSNWTSLYTYYQNNNVDTVDIHYVDNGLGRITYVPNSPAHDIKQITDRMTYETDMNYDSLGRLSTITEAKGTSNETLTQLIYDDPNTYTLKEIDRGGVSIALLSYDNIGRLQKVTYPDGVVINYVYDNLNQTQTISYPDGKNETITNSLACPYVIDSTTDRVGHTTTYTYDCLKRLLQRNGPEGIFYYGYDLNSNLTTLTDPGGKVTTFGYTLDNRLKQKTYAATTEYVSYTYDTAGLLKTFTNARMKTTPPTATYGYDPNNNLTSITYTDSTSNVSMSYDAYNRRITMTTAGLGTYQYTYDANYRLKTICSPWDVCSPLATDSTIIFGYNELNQLTAITTTKPAGQVSQPVSYTYDNIGRLWKITRGSDAPYVYTYETVSSPLATQLSRPSGSYTQYQYNDPLKKLTAVTNNKSNNDLINSFVYTYTDPKHPDFRNSETVTNGLAINNFINGTTTYTPNNLNQITAITDTTTRNYVYDADGNMTTGFMPNNIALSMEYDAENRMTKSYPDSSHKTIYTYSGEGLLAQIVKPTGETIRYIRAGFLPIQERDANNNVTNEYLWGKDKSGGIGGLLNIRQVSQGGKDYNYFYDGRGNVTALIDVSANSVAASYAYDPFGAPGISLAPGFSDQPFKFSTKQYYPDTGQYYYGIRFYDPILGKWTTRDPLWEASDSNLYRAVGNNPVNKIDPYGWMVLPPNPSGLGPEWKPDPTHLDPNGQRFRDDSGRPLDWHPGQPGKPGWGGKDHWHDPNNFGREHLRPGCEIPDPVKPAVVPAEPAAAPMPWWQLLLRYPIIMFPGMECAVFPESCGGGGTI